MRSVAIRMLVVFGSLALVGAGCSGDDSATDVAGDDAPTVADDDGDHDDGDHDDGDHDDGDHDEGDHDEGDHDEGDHDDGMNGDADMVVEIVMSDFAYEMDDLVVPVGSTVRFDFVNEGAIEHEAMFGDAHQQEEFAELGDHSGDHGDAEGHHGEIDAITLEAGGSGSVTVTFDEAGEMMIGCHLPGHWDAGMSATFVVA